MTVLRDVAVHVLTYKDGVLSAVAHDLELRVERCTVEVDDDETSVRASFDPASLRVLHAMKDGAPAPHLLPSLVFGEIERNIARDVLHPQRHPRITFASTAIEDRVVRGELTLCGVTRAIEVQRTREGDVEVGRARIDQREFGITPFSAMLGTLKIKPHVDVVVRIARGAP